MAPILSESGLILTCRVVCERLTGDASRRLLEGVGGGGGGRARAGVITCHVGGGIGGTIVILSILALAKTWIPRVVLGSKRIGD